jgi:hypothetical protein
MDDASERIIEAYVGEYASGKSELSINRALELYAGGRSVYLVDLDTVEPFYTLRPIKDKLQSQGLYVISLERGDAFGLGETGAMLRPAARWALRNPGDVIMDVGYGVHGAGILNLVEGAYESDRLQIIAVINAARPMNDSVDRIIAYIQGLGRVDGIVANTHLGRETTLEAACRGNEIVAAAAERLGVPVFGAAFERKWQAVLAAVSLPYPVRYLDLYMPQAIW